MACSLLPRNVAFYAEVGAYFSRGTAPTRGSVDFFISNGLKWLLEFVIDGSKLDEHVARFDLSTGRYSAIPRTDWLVVDFRPASQGVPAILRDHVLHVLYDAEFTTARVVMKDHAESQITFHGGLIRTLSDQ